MINRLGSISIAQIPFQASRGYSQGADSNGAIFTPDADEIPIFPKIHTAKLFKRPPKLPVANTKLSFLAIFYIQNLRNFLNVCFDLT